MSATKATKTTAASSRLDRGVRRPVEDRTDWPRWWFQKSRQWKTVPMRSCFAMRDIENPCALCGWGRHMAIHSIPEDMPDDGNQALHRWRAKETPNVGGEPHA